MNRGREPCKVQAGAPESRHFRTVDVHNPAGRSVGPAYLDRRARARGGASESKSKIMYQGFLESKTPYPFRIWPLTTGGGFDMFWGSNYCQLLTFITIIELIIGPARRRLKKIAIFGVQFRYFPLSRFELYRVIRSNLE